MALKDWIQKGRELGASDLHLETGTPLVARIRGELTPIGEAIAGTRLAEVGQQLLGAEAWPRFLERGSADVSIVASGLRCRVSLFRTIRGIAMAVRLLAPAVSDLRSCNLHPELRKLVEATSGLAVISGPTGCGKSTTLAALIEELNTSRARNIITLESPLEYVFTNRKSFIRQREIPTHSVSFEQAIIDALRENPDVLVVSEMRTPEAIRLTLNAAETGHLVLATMHSATCAEALSRIVMSFPAEIQGSVRAQLADALVGVVCQRLDFLATYQLRVPRCEILFANSAAKGTLRSGQFSQIANVILSGGEDGMWSFDRYQRWMEQKTDWVRPAARPAAPSAEMVKVVNVPPSTPTPRPPPAARPASSSKPAPASDSPTEISIDEDIDLNELNELARKIEERTR
ncbi:MAG TPA: ATPase, T2SS/T4P/T4SS family [Steroidobacteraceae bacterium]|nr:ATPase, T2SS/T4P/T4SS family [Steroidobacteraceae bacterium]